MRMSISCKITTLIYKKYENAKTKQNLEDPAKEAEC